MRLRVARSGRLEEGCLDLGIEAEGELIGEIQTYRPPGRKLPPDVYELGVVIHEPAHRGRGLGTDAVALLTGWLISDAGARRVQASVRPENAPMRRVLERLGFEVLGRLRGYGAEYVLYAMQGWSSPATERSRSPGERSRDRT